MVASRPQTPKRGDAISIDLDPQAGREQAGRRPALVLSPSAYNNKAGLVIACPITRQAKGYPFEVDIPRGLQVDGVIVEDHVKSLDWRTRNAQIICQLAEATVEDVGAKLNTLTGPVAAP